MILDPWLPPITRILNEVFFSSNFLIFTFFFYSSLIIFPVKMNLLFWLTLNLNSKPDKTWILYFKDITNEKFEIPRLFDNYKIQRKVSLNRLDLILLER